MTDQIEITRNESVAIVTMAKPKRRNALGTESMAGLHLALQSLAGDAAVNAIVLTGSPPALCAGSDLKELGGLSAAAMVEHEAETARVARSIAYLPVPVVAAVEGYALGGGFALATSCDIVVTARGAKWAMPEVANGWIPPWGLRSLLARVGPVKARAIVWGAMDMDGAEAHRLGVADVVVDDGLALAFAKDLAKRLSELPSGAVSSTKRFFEQEAAKSAEYEDAEAARLFAMDCEGDSAKATLAKFTVPA